MSVQEVASQQDGDGEAGDHLEGAGHAQPPCPERQGDCPESHKLIPVFVAQGGCGVIAASYPSGSAFGRMTLAPAPVSPTTEVAIMLDAWRPRKAVVP